jgi:hypothetical protein
MTVRCSSPIDAAALSDYWLALLSGPDEEAVEEHLFQCDSCGDRLREVSALSEGIRRLAREGSLRMIVSETFLRRAAEEGRNVRQYAPSAGGSVECTVTAEDDFLIGRLAADFSKVGRVDLCLCNASGVEQLRLPDIPINRDAGSVILQESITFAKAAPSNKMIMRLVSVDETGSERPIGEYTFNHNRSMPGPAAW